MELRESPQRMQRFKDLFISLECQSGPGIDDQGNSTAIPSFKPRTFKAPALDVATRWNSTFKMLESAFYLKKAFIIIILMF